MQTITSELQPIFTQHVTNLLERHQQLMQKYDFDHIVIPSGELRYVFQDDMTYPFKSNAYFKWLVPFTNHPNCFLSIPQSGKPQLIYYVPKDYWHAVPDLPDENLFSQFDIHIITKSEQAKNLLPSSSAKVAYLGEAPGSFELSSNTQILPEPLLSELHWLRAYKTDYEKVCLYKASLNGARAHNAAKNAFYAGKSELDIHHAYVQAIGTKESDLPYGNIVALNEHAAVLHYTEMQTLKFSENDLRSFLIDAGGRHNDYASDITRTYSYRDDAFAEMIQSMDDKQLEVIAAIKPGDSYIELHKLAHVKVAEVLKEFKVINVSVEEAIESQITSTFLPHGLGHHLGLHVHDAGGHQASPIGGHNAPPSPHDFLRNTREIEVGNYLTIEPGLYFIPQLLADLKEGGHSSSINWSVVNEFLPFGGIRIEDNVFITENSVENFTRQAFAEL